MIKQSSAVNAVIIGGGFYGSAIAIYLAKTRGLQRVVLLERESSIQMRASYNNQARIHNGYHYPRSFTTAFRSRVNMPQFAKDWSQAIKQDFISLYAIARQNSKVTAKQFKHFCHIIGAKIESPDARLKQFFAPRFIEDVFAVEEYVFNSGLLAEWAIKELRDIDVHTEYSTCALSILRSSEDTNLNVIAQSQSGDISSISTKYVFNCTYSGLNQLLGHFPGVRSEIKHELAEMALIKVPEALKGLGITVMDGPFFSILPFPDRDLHTLSHVRYTPHFSWVDQKGVDPYKVHEKYNRITRADRMIRDASRYLPLVLNSQYIDSLFEVKTILTKNEVDDGRPILYEKHAELPGCYSILGGKIDNIFDVFEKLDTEILI